jgi:hypothetical protein
MTSLVAQHTTNLFTILSIIIHEHSTEAKDEVQKFLQLRAKNV